MTRHDVVPRLRSRLAPALLALAITTSAAHAGWIDRLARGALEAGEAGGIGASRTASKLTRLGAPGFEDAAHLVSKLPKTETSTAAAVHMTPEGHWKFASREGEIFTASSPEELARMPAALFPGSEAKPLALYVSEDAVFTSGARISELPSSASLHLVSGTKSFPLLRDGNALAAEVRPGVRLALSSKEAFREGLGYLSKGLNRSSVRILSLDPAGPKTLPSVPRFDRVEGKALVDSIDPASLPSALTRIKGQTALISGRIDGDVLTYLPASGGEQKLFVSELVREAQAADVNLVVVNAAGTRQPGGTNWFWQTVKVANLDEAMARATNADFLAALTGGSKPLTITSSESSSGRIVIAAKPMDEGVTAPLESTVSEWMGELTGHVATRAVDIYARDKSRDDELEARFVAGVPSAIQIGVLTSAILGIIACGVSWSWWTRLWPAEDRAQYASATGYRLARGARFLLYLVVFTPLVGIPAFAWACLLQLWTMLTAPVRALRWVKARIAAT